MWRRFASGIGIVGDGAGMRRGGGGGGGVKTW